MLHIYIVFLSDYTPHWTLWVGFFLLSRTQSLDIPIVFHSSAIIYRHVHYSSSCNQLYFIKISLLWHLPSTVHIHLVKCSFILMSSDYPCLTMSSVLRQSLPKWLDMFESTKRKSIRIEIGQNAREMRHIVCLSTWQFFEAYISHELNNLPQTFHLMCLYMPMLDMSLNTSLNVWASQKYFDKSTNIVPNNWHHAWLTWLRSSLIEPWIFPIMCTNSIQRHSFLYPSPLVSPLQELTADQWIINRCM